MITSEGRWEGSEVRAGRRGVLPGGQKRFSLGDKASAVRCAIKEWSEVK